MDDYLKCKTTNDEPIERYALPSNYKMKFAFHIQPKKIDTLQRGIVQMANGKRGGGKESYFAIMEHFSNNHLTKNTLLWNPKL